MSYRKEPAKGHDLCSKRRICVAFDFDMFEELRRKAEEQKTSFSEQVRLHVEWGLNSYSTEKGYCDNV